MYPEQTKKEAISLLKKGCTTRQTAQRLEVSQQTVSQWLKQSQEQIQRVGSGRKRKLTTRDVRMIVFKMASGKIETATDAARVMWEQYGVRVSRQTISRELHEYGLKSFVKKKKPKLSSVNIKKRKEFAKEHKNWVVADWSRVMFSDETLIPFLCTDGRKYGWKKKGVKPRQSDFQRTLKHGGGRIMVWGCFCAAGVGYINCIQGNMNADDYVRILSSDLLDSLRFYNMTPQSAIFQHDNDPKHTARKTKDWLRDNDITTLPVATTVP